MWKIRLFVHPCWSLLCILCGTTSVIGEEPAAGDWKTAVPAEHARLGRVFHVQPSDRDGVTFTSNASREKFKGRSHQVRGYVVVPTQPGAIPVSFLAGEFRVSVDSFETGNKTRDQHLQGERWLNAKIYPDVVFKLTSVLEPKLVREKNNVATYRAKLVGDMTLLSISREMTIPVTLTLRAPGENAGGQGAGDRLTIKCNYRVKLSDFGIGVDDPAIKAGRVADRLKLQTKLTLVPSAPGGE